MYKVDKETLDSVYELGDKLVFISRESCPDNPRHNDNVAELWCLHRRYTLGDRDAPQDFVNDPALFESEVRADPDALAVCSLFLYDHGGISISRSSFGDRWDSGQVGIGVVRKSRMLHLGFSEEECTRDRADELLTMEVEEYNTYLHGDVFEYEVFEGPCDEVINRGGNYYGNDFVKSGILCEVFGPNWEQARKIYWRAQGELGAARRRVREVYEARGDLDVFTHMPDPTRPGVFFDTAYPSIAAARAALAPWYETPSDQETFLRWNNRTS